MQEQREKVLDRRILTQEGGKTTDLVRECRTDVLRDILAEVAYTRYYPCEDDLLLEELREA